jgi:acetyltransferase-like isoleucine patch superfamily enzyme
VTRRTGFWRRAYEAALRRCRAAVARQQLRGCALGRGVQTTGRVRAEGRHNIRIGDRSKLFGGLVPTQLIAHAGAVLRLGDHCMLNYGTRIEAHERIEIGSDCMFGSAVVICDRDGERTEPVTIEDGVWLAHGARVHPGVRIGRGAVVSAGSVVTTDVPPGTLAVGNPARALPLCLVAPQ